MNPHVLMEGRTVLHVLIVDVVLKGRRYVHWAKVACVRVGGARVSCWEGWQRCGDSCRVVVIVWVGRGGIIVTMDLTMSLRSRLHIFGGR